MKERGILFSAPMVRALLAGRKTQTRRALQTQPASGIWTGRAYRDKAGQTPVFIAGWVTPAADGSTACICPYGVPGDRLWVRESFSGDHMYAAEPPSAWGLNDPIWYWADGNPITGDWTKPKPSIHMPRFASRITLDVTDVRVERLQDISAADCWAEGISHSPDVNPVHEYKDLWDQINGAGSWDANPWVWVVAFRRLER